MGTALDSVKRLFANEKGNLTVTITLLVVVTGAIGFFMAVSDRVDQEIRVLGGTQATAYLKSDVQESIKRTLVQGNHDGCTVGDGIRDMYRDFLRPNKDSIYKLEVRKPSAMSYGAWLPTVRDRINCFFHPSRYAGTTEFNFFKIEMKRSSNPNLLNLSNYLQVEVLIQTVTSGRSSNLRWILRYQVDVLTTASYGAIFNSSGTDPLFELDSGAKLSIEGRTLIDQDDRSKAFALSRLSDFENVSFSQKVFLASPSIVTDAAALDFLEKRSLRDFFKEGIIFDGIQNPAQLVPWKVTTGQFRDLFNYDLIATGRYPLPKLASNESAIATASGGITHLYGNDKENDPIPGGIEAINKNTAGIYNLMFGDKKNLFKSCSSVDVSTGVYNVLVFNNTAEDFTIDFTGNTTLSEPPVFCGLIAARNLIIKLNDSALGAEAYTHHFVGKLLLSGKIILQNKGKLVFTDILNLDQDTISPYEVIDDHTSVQVQFLNQKFYSAQNFALPFFNDPTIYADTNFVSGINRFWVPRDTKELFVRDCSGKKCRQSPIGSPASPEEILTRHASALTYEVTNVE